MSENPFLNPDPERVFYRTNLVLGLWDAYPVSPGHALLVTRRQVADWFGASLEEQAALMRGIQVARQAIEEQYQPQGYNIGMNLGKAAGQTIFHLHMHIIPRYQGDVPDPSGGVRHVIPAKGNYLVDSAGLVTEVPTRPYAAGGRLVSGQEDPLLPHLLRDLDQAVCADLAVAFLQPGGVDAILAHLHDLVVQRRGRLRLVTGDYLDITHPTALETLLDLATDPSSAGRVQVRVFESSKASLSFHPKAYLFTDPLQRCTAYIGSSNLSRAALTEGVEWNYRFIDSADPAGLKQAQQAFELLFFAPQTVELSENWLQQYRRRRVPLPSIAPQPVEMLDDLPPAPVKPHPVQVEALAALRATRQAGNQAGLVVLATGLGKTWLSAFDSVQFQRILFVAHREEILGQAMATFRRIRPGARVGLYTGQEKSPEADILFASVQTLGKTRHHRLFSPKAFDYIVVDEFHHAAAATYRRLMDYFEPQFLLGLTATPERADGGDLLGLCGENLVYRCDVVEGIQRELLCPFHYFGVPDEVDYAAIPWRSNRFDPEALTAAVATRSRAESALEQYRRHGGQRTVAFCCSQVHADYMANFFKEKGLRAVAVHSGPNSAPRATSLEALQRGDLDILCCVDMFNEGLDLPQVDTVMMLRPTESRVIWLQQFGRGLRRAEGKERLKVIDYIGNHRTFLLKLQTLWLELQGGSGVSDAQLSYALKRLQAGELDLPAGCEVTYDLIAIDILKALLRTPKKDDALRVYYEDCLAINGRRPTALEAYHDGFNPRSLHKSYGSWVGFVATMGGLSEAENKVFEGNREFLEVLGTTPMTKSYEMLLLQSMLHRDCFPGSIGIEELTQSFGRLARRSAILREDVGQSLQDDSALSGLLEKNPISAWCGGKGSQGNRYFAYHNGILSTQGLKGDRELLQQLVREMIDWRLAEYLDRPNPSTEGFECRVSHNGSNPILFLPDRKSCPGLPFGETSVTANGKELLANFVKVAVNVIKAPDSDTNQLPALLRGWFGPDAGRPGTRHVVQFGKTESGYTMTPLGAAAQEAATLWKRYTREQIPPLFGLEFNTGLWNQGFVLTGKTMVLLVTLDKENLADSFQYADKFVSHTRFQWQSQNQTRQDSKHGQAILRHRQEGIAVHLFVRRGKRQVGGAAPFVYCGQVSFVEWKGELPITVQWELPQALPARLWEEFTG